MANLPLAGQLPAEFVLPVYDGRSIANLPATIGHLLGQTRGWALPPLAEALWSGLGQDIERVILLLLDGIGWRQLWKVVAEQDPAFSDLLARWGAVVEPITSVVPATTTVATTSLWTNGAAPAEHGMLGFTFLLARQSALCNLLFWQPVGMGGGRGTLEQWGVVPETFLSVPSIAQQLEAGGITTTSLMPASIMDSPLSRMQMRGARVRGYRNSTDLWMSLLEWMEQSRGNRAYCYAYYPAFDEISHRDGPGAPSWRALWQDLRRQFDHFLARLPGGAGRRTLLLLSADHGHVTSPVERYHRLADHPELADHLMLMPGGEARHSYLYGRPGHLDGIRAYHERWLADDFLLLDSTEALHGGLYGPPERLHVDAERRLGNFALLSRDQASLWRTVPPVPFLGMHGSLVAEEMIVPYIAFRLDR